MDKRTVFIADDDQGLQNFLFTFLSTRGYRVECFSSGEALLSRLWAGDRTGLILLDVVMPGCDGVEVIQKIRAMGSKVPVIMLSGLADIRTVVESVKFGASNFLMKPFDEYALENMIKEVFEQRATGESISSESAAETSDGREFLTKSPMMLRMAGIVRQVAFTDVPIMILGESGVGKEVMARFAHRHSGREDKPFVKINCAAIPHELLESELFGYERGAFTGAMNDKVGKFEQAHTGTLLLDEIGEMSAHLQSKLLHVLQDGTFSRLGGRKTVKVDVRIIAATNIKLDEAIAKGKFREDLYYRLNVVRIDLPSLRDRIEDIPQLCDHFIALYRERYNSSISSVPIPLLQSFAKYQWPGNIRQLENLVKRYLLLGNWEDIAKELYSGSLEVSEMTSADQSLGSLLEVGAAAADHAERQLVYRVLGETKGNRKKAARQLNVSYKALLNKIKRWNADQPSLAVIQANVASGF
ncbi:MAG TPA: sigma-54 dependent transcriptional regulator [Terriglobia bacterium]|nr:sigma-54 dependent transcriptional regulator [Terriglobia bacterium]